MMFVLRVLSGIFLLACALMAINPKWANKDGKGDPITRKQAAIGAVVCLVLFFAFGGFGHGAATTTAAPSATAASSSISALTPSDIQDYENGVILQANNTLNSAQNGISSLMNSLSNGEITADEFRTKASTVNDITNSAYTLFKGEKSPSALQPITDKYNSLIKQVVDIESQFEMTSEGGLKDLQSKLNGLISQKAGIDQQFAAIKNTVMKKASAQATSATKASDSYLKPGPDKVATNGGLGDTFSVIKTAFGQPTRVNQEMTQGVGMYGFQNDKLLVNFVESRADHVTYQLNQGIVMEQAKELAKGLMPPDAKFIKQYSQGNQQFYVYQSRQLSTLFDSSWFENADGQVQPGYFDIAYFIDNGQVTAVDSFISDNP